MRTRAQGVEDATPDVTLLSTAFAIPQSEVQALLDGPTAELVQDFLTTLTLKAQEFDILRAEKLRVDVELENTVRTSETKLRAQKATVTKHVKEVEELRVQLNEADSARESLAIELERLRTSTFHSTDETHTLRQRVESLEASNRDALALVENKSSEKDRLATELSEQHSKLLTLRREVHQLEERSQTLENAASSQKFKEQSLQQEIELLKRNNEWHATELQTRNQEYSKFRKERNARITSLQRELEESTSTVESLKRTESNLRQRLDDVQGKADEAFTEVASLQEEIARKEQGWKAELEGSKRLADLQAQNAATHKARLHEVEAQLEQVRLDASNEISRIQAELETERKEKTMSDAKIAELELTVEQLESQPRLSQPATPLHNGAVNVGTPGRAGSPFPLAASARKSGRPLTNTEYVARINELTSELGAERRRTQKLSSAMDDMINQIETRGPELTELRDDHQRLEQEVMTFSQLLEESNSDRDNAKKETERWQSEAESRAREGDILRQQLRDLSAQIKILLVEMQIRDQGLKAMSSSERYQLEQTARGEATDWSEDDTTTNQLISHNLVIFRSVSQLQEQNQRLLQITRDLGEQMEGEEARKKAAESKANALEAEQLRQQVAQCKDELKSMSTQMESYVKERDMFRRMIQHRGQLPKDADYQAIFGQSISPTTPQRAESVAVAETPRAKEAEDMNKLLKEQQTFFDQYRNESAQDRKTLKDQVDALTRDKSTLQADVAHWKSQKTLADERLHMLQANYNGLRAENSELQKRANETAETAAKQDLRTQQVAEELVEARSMAESLRNENANAKAERELWKRIETRLAEDNKALMDERSRLNKLVTDLQSLQNERELSDSESRRKLQSRVESLEAELAETKKRFDQELEDSRKATLRREYEDGESRKRIDDLVKSLGNVREELVAAKTTRDQLQARVDEMKIELHSSEERVAALQPRPTPRAQPSQNGGDLANGDDELSTEQRLALEISDLRRDLQFAQNELESAKQEVEQYRSISQATEEELQHFNETSDQYKEEVDRQIAEKDARISGLQQRIDDVLAELSTTNNELSNLRTKHDDASRSLTEQRATFESELARLKDDAERYLDEKTLYQADLKAQAEIAQQAQQSYEDELVKHAEAAKGLQSVRRDCNDLRVELASTRAEADAAKVSLEAGEESWTGQRDKFEMELAEVKRKRQDVDEQNRLLHQQMEAFSSELAALREGRSLPSVERGQSTGTASADGNMQEVVRYLRREKEIVDVQYELSMQESKRLQQQLEYANGQLEETRQKLAEERRRSSDRLSSENSTTKLMQTINELNLFRESSTTLRNEARQAREKLEEKSKEVERLLSDTAPLKVRIGELEGDLEGRVGEIQLLQNDRDHWRERTQNIISKYDRVDPAELEEMKQELADLKAEKERLQGEQAPLLEQIAGIEQTVKTAVDEHTQALNNKLDNFRNQAKEQNRKQNAKIKDGEAALEAANIEKTNIQQELAAAKSELEETKSALVTARSQAANISAASVGDGEAEDTPDPAVLQARLAQAEKNAHDQSSRAETLAIEVQTLENRVQELEKQVAALQQQLASSAPGEDGEIASNEFTNAGVLENLRQELATAQKEVDYLRASATSTAGTDVNTSPQSAPDERSVAEQVAAEVNKLRAAIEAQHDLAKKQMEEDVNRRIENMKNNLRRQLREEKDRMRETVREELIQEHSMELQKLRDEHEAAMAKLTEAHNAEIAKLTKEGGVAVAKADVPTQGVKSETEKESEWPTEDQMLHLMKTSLRVKGIFNSNINKRVAVETEKARKSIAEKDEEIEKLKQARRADGGFDGAVELQEKLAAADEDKKKAVQQAIENEGKKVRVQLSQRDIAQAKLAVVRKAAQETPEKPVKEVWEVADKAKPAPKPSALATAASPAQNSSATVNTPGPASPRSDFQTRQQNSLKPPDQSMQELTDEERLKLRQQRFGGSVGETAQTQLPKPSTFGQPNAGVSGIRPPSSASGTVGQPSQPGNLSQPARRPSASALDPQVSSFAPSSESAPGGAQVTRRPSQQSLRGGSQASRGALASGPNNGAPSVQGTANATVAQGTNASIRGSALPRANAGARGRGAMNRGGVNAGQKRQHEGSDGGDSKRTRGGGPGGV